MTLTAAKPHEQRTRPDFECAKWPRRAASADFAADK